jgi:hypothetical protein
MYSAHRASAFVLAGLLLLMPTTAQAAPALVTSVIGVGPNGLCCNMVNVGTEPIVVSDRFFDAAGNPASTPDVVSLAPGNGSVHCSGATGQNLYCRFEVTTGRVKGLRASACIPGTPDMDGNQPCLATEPAR